MIQDWVDFNLEGTIVHHQGVEEWDMIFHMTVKNNWQTHNKIVHNHDFIAKTSVYVTENQSRSNDQLQWTREFCKVHTDMSDGSL